MKKTLLLLALLVTGELGFQTTEAYIGYFEAYYALFLGNKFYLSALLYKLHATGKQRKAVNKIHECYNEAGKQGKFKEVLILHFIRKSPECQNYYGTDIRQIFRYNILNQ